MSSHRGWAGSRLQYSSIQDIVVRNQTRICYLFMPELVMPQTKGESDCSDDSAKGNRCCGSELRNSSNHHQIRNISVIFLHVQEVVKVDLMMNVSASLSFN